jgi:osmotically-inducible protein OsmY
MKTSFTFTIFTVPIERMSETLLVRGIAHQIHGEVAPRYIIGREFKCLKAKQKQATQQRLRAYQSEQLFANLEAAFQVLPRDGVVLLKGSAHENAVWRSDSLIHTALKAAGVTGNKGQQRSGQ